MYSLPILLTLFISINVQAQSNNTDVKIKKLFQKGHKTKVTKVLITYMNS